MISAENLWISIWIWMGNFISTASLTIRVSKICHLIDVKFIESAVAVVVDVV